MCNPASFVVVKDGRSLRALWHKEVSDSHEDIIEIFGLKERNIRGEYTFVRVEIAPPRYNYKLPPSKWKYKLDQDLKPDWYNGAKVEAAVRKELPGWIKEKIVKEGKVRAEIKYAHVAVVYGTVQTVYGNGIVENVRENGKVQAVRDNGKVLNVYGNGTVQAVRDNGKVLNVYDNGKVGNVYDNGKVQTVRENGKVENVYDNGKVLNVYDNGKVGNVYGNGKVQTVYNNGKVETVYDNGKVENVYGNGMVFLSRVLTKDDLKALKGRNAVIIDRSGKKVKCYCGHEVIK